MKQENYTHGASERGMSRKFFSIRWKLMALFVLCVMLPTIALGVVNYQTYRKEVISNTIRDIKLIALGWLTATDIYYEEVERIFRREQVLVEQHLSSVTRTVKKMLEVHFESGGTIEGAEFQKILEKIASVEVGHRGHIFIINSQGKYILSPGRIYDGKSIFDVNADNPAEQYKNMIAQAVTLKGDQTKVFHYVWSGTLNDDPARKFAVAAYIPGHDLIVAASVTDADFKSYSLEKILQDELKQRMAAQKIGIKGYVWVITSKGEYVVSKGRRADGKNVMDVRDSHGRYFIRDIVEWGQSLVEGDSFTIEYDGKNFGEETLRRKLAAFVYHPGWDWIIGATADEEDFLRGLPIIRRQIIEICFVFILAGLLLGYLFSMLLSAPLRKLRDVASSGDIHRPIEQGVLSGNDEIGALGVAFEGMRHDLRNKLDELERSRQELLQKNEQLQHAQRQLVQSEKLAAIGQLAAGVAHEINNPLAYVMSNVETLEQYVARYEEIVLEYEKLLKQRDRWRTIDDARADVAFACKQSRDSQFERIRWDIKAMIPELRDGLSRVRRIVLDLRSFARVEQEARIEVNIEEVLEQVLSIVWNEIKYKAEIKRDYAHVPKVLCHQQRIGQVLMNILINAAQAVAAGKGKINIKTYADDSFVYVDIADNGVGISPENMPKVFEPFFTTKPVGKGTGLGLSISYDIVRKHGGDIRVTSSVGQGTVFTVMLPFVSSKDGRGLSQESGFLEI